MPSCVASLFAIARKRANGIGLRLFIGQSLFAQRTLQLRIIDADAVLQTGSRATTVVVCFEISELRNAVET